MSKKKNAEQLRPAGAYTAAELLGERSATCQRFRLAGDASGIVWCGLRRRHHSRSGELTRVEISRIEGPAIGGVAHQQDIPAGTYLVPVS